MIQQLVFGCCFSVGLFWVDVFYFFSIFSDPSYAYPFGVPCSSFDTFKPNAIFHGPGLGLAEIDGDLSGYEFKILDKNGVLVDFYGPNEVYTVQLRKRSGFFRGFLIQARVVQPFSNSRDDSLVEKIGHKRVGYFISDTTWPDQGIQYQSCEDDDQLDSVMHLNSRIKRKIEVQWKTDGTTGDVQFLLTVVESLKRYYDNWRPKSGKLTRSNKSSLSMESRKSSLPNFWERRVTLTSNGHVFTSAQITSAVTVKRSFFISASETVGSTATETTFGQTTTVPKTVADVSSDPCKSFPCYNNGTCLATSSDNFSCRCTKEWLGSLCLDPNFCNDDPCKNGGKCWNGGSYPICQCPQNYTGEFCQHFCPMDMCLNGGKCRVNGRNLYSCECKTGWTGARCQLNINECASNPCKIGQCIDRINGYVCRCPRGLMGSRCHRPCEDIYNSCSVWKSENSCDKFRQKSSFFDTHCAKSCEMCSVDQNLDAAKFSGFSPSLEPLAFLLGRWVFNGTSLRRYPIDYTRREINQFLNQIEFIPCRPNMFRIPSLKYKFIGLGLGDSADSVVSQGFLYAMTAEDGVKVVLHASSNEGFITMEEGSLLAGRVLELVTTIGIPFKDDSFLDANLKKNIRRSFEITTNNYLRETIERMDIDDERIIYANYYQLKESYKPF